MKEPIVPDVNITIIFRPAKSNAIVSANFLGNPEKSPSTADLNGLAIIQFDIGTSPVLDVPIMAIPVMLYEEKPR